ncbi:MAG: LTA synthase family protein [Clostridia bacterium]|nr:LTA synthase family protein [Clostridia bacterium]
MKKDVELMQKRLAPRLILTVLLGVLWLLAAILLALSVWYRATFNMTFDDLLFTLLSPLGGTGGSTVSQILSAVVPPVLVLMLLYVAVVVALWKQTRIRFILRRVCAGVLAVAFVFTVVFTLDSFKIPQWIKSQGGTTEIYEEYYIDPSDVEITDEDGNAQNLIYIYLESMETTYVSKEGGGAQEKINYIPHLTDLAFANISFSDSSPYHIGGFHSIAGTSWTMGALMGTTSGVPFSLSVFGQNSHNSLGKNGKFVNGLTNLGDILEEKGYNQEFLCGSNASFAGRDTYFTVHGNYEIFDYYTAIEEGYIENGYYVWWGYEDAILFDIARDELTELAAEDEPFNFTMLTVDTHHVGGYGCSECGDEYDTNLENVIACTDRLVGEFIEWCKTQPFYEDTTIIITGDHPRMDTQLVDDVSFYDRTIYNCFINSVVTPVWAYNRDFTSLDLFPTILSAMGFEIDGERLGLGTNIFSELPTLMEKYGYDWLESELSKYSYYYEENFVK